MLDYGWPCFAFTFAVVQLTARVSIRASATRHNTLSASASRMSHVPSQALVYAWRLLMARWWIHRISHEAFEIYKDLTIKERMASCIIIVLQLVLLTITVKSQNYAQCSSTAMDPLTVSPYTFICDWLSVSNSWWKMVRKLCFCRQYEVHCRLLRCRKWCKPLWHRLKLTFGTWTNNRIPWRPIFDFKAKKLNSSETYSHYNASHTLLFTLHIHGYAQSRSSFQHCARVASQHHL